MILAFALLLVFCLVEFVAWSAHKYLILGFIYHVNFYIGFGFGIALYGLVYFQVHDVLIHERIKWFDNTNNPYFNAIRKAHKVHHEKRGKEGREHFGMVLIPKKHFNS